MHFSVPSGYKSKKQQEASGMEDGYEALVQAIVLQAMEDYRRASRSLRRRPDRASARAMIRDVEQFFCSMWFVRITGLDGNEILEKLKGETA
jgi:hypothetical protein